VTKQLVQSNLNLKGGIAVLLVGGQVALFDERNRLVWCFRGEDIAKGDILETEVLANVVVVGDVDASRDTVGC
jgi:hypothetical protein